MARNKTPRINSSSKDIDAFIDQVNKTPSITFSSGKGRLLFALDATASRQRSWDHACQLQAEMFQEAGSLGGLQMQLCYFQGYGEFNISDWLEDSAPLTQLMNRTQCAAGHTQIEKVLQHALQETRKQKIQAVIYIGDSMEETLNRLCANAGELGLLGTPVFLFQEGTDIIARQAMQEIARLSGGAWCPFNNQSAEQLGKLLKAVTVYACGGKKALQHFADQEGGEVLKLCQQIK